MGTIVEEMNAVQENSLIVVEAGGKERLFLVFKKRVSIENDRVVLEGFFDYQILSNIKILFEKISPREIILFDNKIFRIFKMPTKEEKREFELLIFEKLNLYKKEMLEALENNKLKLKDIFAEVKPCVEPISPGNYCPDCGGLCSNEHHTRRW